jgi:3-hydroxyisobutyrate dehydrogenase-like beta-hydroxyacid dehydrogenase
MTEPTVGLLHPGEMGAALGAILRAQGIEVVWASENRSEATRRRAEEAGLRDVDSAGAVARASTVIVSVCPPHAALDVARSVGRFDGLFVDANAVAPATALEVANVVEDAGATYVDGGVIGPPPRAGTGTRLYLAGAAAPAIADLFVGTTVDARVLENRVGAASALKMTYAAWSKGTAALLLAIRALARSEGVEAALLAEWELALPELRDDSVRVARAAARKGWRWVGEMEEIAATFAAARLPDGFHRAAAEVFDRTERDDEPGEHVLDDVLGQIRDAQRSAGSRA